MPRYKCDVKDCDHGTLSKYCKQHRRNLREKGKISKVGSSRVKDNLLIIRKNGKDYFLRIDDEDIEYIRSKKWYIHIRGHVETKIKENTYSLYQCLSKLRYKLNPQLNKPPNLSKKQVEIKRISESDLTWQEIFKIKVPKGFRVQFRKGKSIPYLKAAGNLGTIDYSTLGWIVILKTRRYKIYNTLEDAIKDNFKLSRKSPILKKNRYENSQGYLPPTV
jgi:hypothetical protein